MLKKIKGNSGKFKVTQENFWSLREDFLTQKVATRLKKISNGKIILKTNYLTNENLYLL